MATALHGDGGFVYYNGSAIALVHKWSMNFDYNLDDITAMDSGGWAQTMVGIKKVTGNVVVGYATDDTAGQTIMRNNAIGGSALVLKLNPNGTASYFSGTAFLKLSMDVAFDSPIEATYDFSSHGPWTYTGT